MGFKNMNRGWDICSSPPWVPFYPYTMFQNPVSWPSHKKCRKTIITQKVPVTQSSNIVHCNQHTQNLHVQICKPLQTLFPCGNWCFFSVFCQGELRKQQNFTFCWFWLGKMHQNGLSGAYWGLEACQIQWHLLQGSMMSGSWKITILGDT